LAVCPKNTGGPGGTYRVDQRGLDALVALGIYHLESGLKASVRFFLSLTCVVCNYFAQIMLCNVVWTVKTTKYANWLLFVFVLCYLFNSDYEHAF